MKISYNSKLKQVTRNLRNNSTLAEVLLWNELKSRKISGYQFMRQKPIGNYIVDFYCSKLRLIIEIDGSSHRFKLDEDAARERGLNRMGLTVLRFEDGEVKKDMKSVLYTIESWIHLHGNVGERG